MAKLRDLDNGVLGLLRGFGLKYGQVSEAAFLARVWELVAVHAGLEALMAPLLQARDAVKTKRERLHRLVLIAVRDDEVCRRLMTLPSVFGQSRQIWKKLPAELLSSFSGRASRLRWAGFGSISYCWRVMSYRPERATYGVRSG